MQILLSDNDDVKHVLCCSEKPKDMALLGINLPEQTSPTCKTSNTE
jgi:hypothetical protein